MEYCVPVFQIKSYVFTSLPIIRITSLILTYFKCSVDVCLYLIDVLSLNINEGSLLFFFPIGISSCEVPVSRIFFY